MSYRTIVLVILALSAFVCEIEAQTAAATFHYQSLVEEGEISHRAHLDTYLYIGERCGAWTYIYGESEYFSAVGGPFCDLFAFGEESVFELGAAVGAEWYQDEDGGYEAHRLITGLLYVGNPSLYIEVIREFYDEGGGWTRFDAVWQMNEVLGVGLIHQTGDGTGPRATLTIPDSGFTVWGAPLGGGRLLLGASLTFER